MTEHEFSLGDFNKQYGHENENPKSLQVENSSDYVNASKAASDLLKIKREIGALDSDIYNLDKAPTDEKHLRGERERLVNEYVATIGMILECLSKNSVKTNDYLAKIALEIDACNGYISHMEEESRLINALSDRGEEDSREDIAKYQDRLEALVLLEDEIRYAVR